ncbi:MAG: type II toxin-antitoxin system death-on-curing family toxin [Deltaproteobacteria bacterium]
MIFIDIEDVLMFHKKIIKQTGGADGVLNMGLIESAIKRPFATFDGKQLYPDDIDKISAIVYSLINNHGFVDGNKRIGMAVMLLLLKINDIELIYEQKEFVELGLNIASGKFKEDDIKNWIKRHKK